jgi:DNA gyrase subunit A
VIGRGSAGVRLFNVAEGEHIVSAVRLDEQEEPETEAEELIAEDMIGRDSPETGPEPTPDRDGPDEA